MYFRLYDLILFGAAVFMCLSPTAEHVLTFIRVGTVKPVVPSLQGVHVTGTEFAAKNCNKIKGFRAHPFLKDLKDFTALQNIPHISCYVGKLSPLLYIEKLLKWYNVRYSSQLGH